MPNKPEQVIVSWSELDNYRHCPHQHQLAYKERWVPPTTAPALSKGIAFHTLMEYHYRALQECPGDLARARLIAWNGLNQDPRGVLSEETRDLMHWMYDGYVEMWGADPDWEILAVEERFNVPIPTAGGYPSRFTLKMGVDLVIKDRSARNKIFLVDHKSGANLPQRKTLDLSDQFTLYIWGLIQSGYPVFGALWNGARTQRNKTKVQPLPERFARPLLARTPFEIETVVREAYATARTAYSARNLHERHPDPDSCGWRCSYVEACLMGRKTGPVKEREYLQDAGFRQNFERH